MTIDTVVFDVGNVLISWDARRVYPELSDEAFEAFADEVGFSAWNLDQDRGRATWAEAVAGLSAHYPHRAELIRRFSDDWQQAVSGAIDESVAVVDELARRDMALYAITNFSAEKWEESCARFSFLNSSFRDVVVSAHVGLVKPDARIYEALLETHNLTAQSCVFIDDSLVNVAGARAVGMRAIHFTSPAQMRDDLVQLGVL